MNGWPKLNAGRAVVLLQWSTEYRTNRGLEANEKINEHFHDQSHDQASFPFLSLFLPLRNLHLNRNDVVKARDQTS